MPEEMCDCLHFAIWVDGMEKAIIGAHVGSMITIPSPTGSFGLATSVAESEDGGPACTLLRLKSSTERKGEEIRRVELPYGKAVSLAPGIKIAALRRTKHAGPRHPLESDRCCVPIPGFDSYWCATCFIYLPFGSCCTSIDCCAQLAIVIMENMVNAPEE